MVNDVQLSQARSVRCDNLEPCQRATNPRFKIACDFRQQVMLKHPYLSEFHSRHEHLHAGLLEANPDVLAYTPQPFQLYVHHARYTPDVYVVMRNGKVRVIEIKPHGEMDEAKRLAIDAFLALYNLSFEVMSNETIAEQEVQAQSWLEIVQRLARAEAMDTQTEELAVLERLTTAPALTVGDLVDAGARDNSYLTEIALYRLAHRGLVQMDFASDPLSYDTELSLCT